MRTRTLFGVVFCALALAHLSGQTAPAPPPLKLAIAGLVHGHVSGFLRGAQGRSDVQIVGVFDPTRRCCAIRRTQQPAGDGAVHRCRRMLDRAKPEAVASFTNTFDHPVVVEAAAARHIDVMMEKPLAVSNADAQRISARGGSAAASRSSSTTRRPGIRVTARSGR